MYKEIKAFGLQEEREGEVTSPLGVCDDNFLKISYKVVVLLNS